MNICATARPEPVFAFVMRFVGSPLFAVIVCRKFAKAAAFSWYLQRSRNPRSKNCPVGQINNFLSSPLAKNIPLSLSGKSALPARAIPPHRRGVCAIVTKREAGCGGRDGAQDERANAYGEVVWS
jgi:hypothetical protein